MTTNDLLGAHPNQYRQSQTSVHIEYSPRVRWILSSLKCQHENRWAWCNVGRDAEAKSISADRTILFANSTSIRRGYPSCTIYTNTGTRNFYFDASQEQIIKCWKKLWTTLDKMKEDTIRKSKVFQVKNKRKTKRRKQTARTLLTTYFRMLGANRIRIQFETLTSSIGTLPYKSLHQTLKFWW